MRESYYEKLANIAANRGVTCENCIYYVACPDWGEAAGECHAPHVLGPPYWVHDYRRLCVVCFAYRRRPDIVKEKRIRDYPRDFILHHGVNIGHLDEED